MRNYARAQNQQREVLALYDQVLQGTMRIRGTIVQWILDDWPAQYFTEQDADVLDWRAEVNRKLGEIRKKLLDQMGEFYAIFEESYRNDPRLNQWRIRVLATERTHEVLQLKLAEQGVSDPQAFARLVQERAQWETEHKRLSALQSDYEQLRKDIEAQQALLLEKKTSHYAATAILHQAGAGG